MRIKHIIWDWNGTLLDDTQAGMNAVNAMLRVRGLPTLGLAHYRETFGFPVRDFYHTVGFRLETENWDTMADEFHRNFLCDTTIRLHTQTVATLEYVSSVGISQSVLSASEQSILENMLSEYGLSHFFEHVYGVDNLYGHSKLEIGQTLLKAIGLPTNEIILIGDSLHDHEVARHLDVGCLLIAQGHQSRSRLLQSSATVLSDLPELTEWLHRVASC
ncbi:MAG: HAD family hydrolase [Kiritimatiellae bacterium]|nr:HAD family hydrolase [Kiritimatiellia bacterium]